MANEFSLSRDEEMICRELEALSGDLQQLSENLIRHHKEREEQAKRRAEQMDKTGGPAIGMMAMNRPAVLTDLRFLRDRLNLLIDYLAGEQRKSPGAM